ncbi:MAG: SDR family NAD(P)-dependent oxidoreductase, partial [Pseudomonadota bacterium]
MPEPCPVLLVAGAGYTGGRLALRAAGAGWDVLALRRREVPVGADVRALRADLRSGEGLAALPKHLDALVYCPTPDERTEDVYRVLYRD